MAEPTAAPTRTPSHPALMLTAPLLEELAVLLADVVLEEDLLVVVEVAEPDWEGADVAPARGAVDWPAISDETCGVNWPDIPFRANCAEKARAGYCGNLGSFSLRDSKRMKYLLLLGPILGSTTNEMEELADTLAAGAINWRRVCS